MAGRQVRVDIDFIPLGPDSKGHASVVVSRGVRRPRRPRRAPARIVPIIQETPVQMCPIPATPIDPQAIPTTPIEATVIPTEIIAPAIEVETND